MHKQSSWLALLGVIALFALCLLAFWPAVHGGFIWDDWLFIIQNPLVRTADGPIAMWSGTESEDYWPLSYSLFWLEWRLWGLQTFGYHLVNILMHGAVASLLWLLLCQLWGKRGRAWIVAALFAVHPVNVESVAWIFQTKTTLCALFACLALLAFVQWSRGRSKVFYCLSLLFFLLSLLSKLASLFLPLVLSGLLLRGAPAALRRRHLGALAPFFACAAAMGLHGIWYRALRAPMDEKMLGDDGMMFERLAIAARAIWFYLGKVLLPLNLSFVYPRWPVHGDNGIKLLAMSALILTFILCGRTCAPMAQKAQAGLFFMVALLLPCLGLSDFSFMRYSFVADHYLYLALVVPLGFGVLVCCDGVSYWRERSEPLARMLASRAGGLLAPAVAGALLIVALVASRERSGAFRDEETLWRDTLAKNPLAILAHNNLANLLEARGEGREAEEHYAQIVRLTENNCSSPPLCAGAHFNLGRLFGAKESFPEAISHYQRAIAIYPKLAYAHYNLGLLWDQTGRRGEGIAEIREAIRLMPAEATFHLGLGVLLLAAGDSAGAEVALLEALRLNNSLAEGYNQLALIALRRGQTAEAATRLHQALRFAPGLVEARVRLAQLLAQQGDRAAALEHLHEAQRSVPTDPVVARLIESLEHTVDAAGSH